MLYSQLFGKTLRESPKDEIALNARLLIRAGFIYKEMAGVYVFLPLGLRVISKLTQIIKEEMDSIKAQQITLSALQNLGNWQITGRDKNFDALFKIQSRYGYEYALGPTHEEELTPLVKSFVSSYKDLPLYLYQIQTKFRDEKRAKGGLLRGREFLMKDLYSFHSSKEDLDQFYITVQKAYEVIFNRVGIKAIKTQASGGAFSDFSDEYQVISDAGEDEIIYCPGGDFSSNTEIAKVSEGKQCDLGHGSLLKAKSIEVGNIFHLNTKFSDAFGLTFKDKMGKEQKVWMGCYGMGISRLMGTIVEVCNDKKGIVWPEAVSPYAVYLISIGKDDYADDLYRQLLASGIEILYDDRKVPVGEKFADADLLGFPVRLVVSVKTEEKVEWKDRSSQKIQLLDKEEIIKKLKGTVS